MDDGEEEESVALSEDTWMKSKRRKKGNKKKEGTKGTGSNKGWGGGPGCGTLLMVGGNRPQYRVGMRRQTMEENLDVDALP